MYRGVYSVESVLDIASPAKINLTLNVLGKRPDGYHDLDSIVQTVSLFDRLYIKQNESGEINLGCNRDDVPLGPDNLIVQVCQLMKCNGLLESGLDIILEKNIPMQAGLGGGSSNAASILIALNKLFNLNLSKTKLLLLGSEIGSDVALFLLGGTVRMTGRGEIVKSLHNSLHFYYLIVKPDSGVSTSWAYAELDKRKTKQDIAQGDLGEKAWLAGDSKEMLRLMGNDFQTLVQETVLETLEIEKRLLDSGANRVLLAGSGSSMVGVFLDRNVRDSAHSILKGVYTNIWSCETFSSQDFISVT